MDQVYIPNKDYKVLVRCMTYNQSKYIEDALNGFAMQQTDFPFVCLVMDDCSTDGEQEVIKSWMERECDMEKAENIEIEKSFVTLVPHKSNLNCQFAFYFLKENLYKKGGKAPMIAPWREHCEYEAMCEGDDYWIDQLKLQKQVLWLDGHPDYSMCFGAVMDLLPDGSMNQVNRYNENNYDCPILDLIHIGGELGGGYAKICTIMYHIGKYSNGYLSWTIGTLVGDLPMQLTLFTKGKVAYINDVLAVYRRTSSDNAWSVKMVKNKEFQRRYFIQAKKMWSDFDKYTEYAYHNHMKKIFRFLFRYRLYLLLLYYARPIIDIIKKHI